MVKIEWVPVFNRVDKVKTRLYLQKNGRYYDFCWLSFLKRDGSLSFGLKHNKLIVTELGSATRVDGGFKGHFPTLRRSDIIKSQINDVHMTLHPPFLTQKSGIGHIRSGNKTISRWHLDWFPVKYPQCLIHFYSGDVTKLKQVNKPKKDSFVIPVKRNQTFVRMDVILLPRKSGLKAKLRQYVDIAGETPHYIVVCRTHATQERDAGLYVATDNCTRKSP